MPDWMEHKRLQDLRFPKLIEQMGEHFQVDEATAALTLKPPVTSDQAGSAIFAVLARTATLFLVDHDEMMDAANSADEAPLLPQLPPLPSTHRSRVCAGGDLVLRHWQEGRPGRGPGDVPDQRSATRRG